MRSSHSIRVGLLCVAALLAGQAFAQYNPALSARTSNRPSDTLGIVGGANTIAPDRVAGRSGLQPGMGLGGLGDSRRRGGGAAGDQGGGTFGGIAEPLISPNLRQDYMRDLHPGFGGPGLFKLRPSPSIALNYDVSPRMLADLSGLSGATSLDTPEGGWGSTAPRNIGNLFAAANDAPQASGFHAYFGLVPAPPDAVGAEPPKSITGADLAGRILDSVDRRMSFMGVRGFEAFREGMTSSNPQQKASSLAQAMQLLGAVRDLDEETYLAPQLMFHASLERDQISQAVRHLHDAVRRHPELFIERTDISHYFGDKDVMRRQMRRFATLGRLNPTVYEAFIVEGYCHWALGEMPQARQALAKAVELPQPAATRDQARLIKTALDAAAE